MSDNGTRKWRSQNNQGTWKCRTKLVLQQLSIGGFFFISNEINSSRPPLAIGVASLPAGPWTSILWSSILPSHSSSQNCSQFISSYLHLFSSKNPSPVGTFTTRDIRNVPYYVVHNLFLGFWHNRRLASLCHYTSLSFRMKQHDSHRTDLCETSYLGLSFKCMVKFRYF
jgi:hypothetical protein